ncbi:membrane protein involved in the export of O-antigen and teichoic acid [Leptolyngbya sp. BL0902]|nr:membrane protein involved in the export of O-antigen and teichoic acid [Leptolyngbya sp. BL0902]
MLITRALSMVIQVAYFIILARYLGSEYYGIFEGSKAIWAIIFPFVGMGASDLLVQDVSRENRVFSQRWGDALSLVLLSAGVVALAIFPVVAFFFSSVPPLFIFLTLVADLVGLKLCGFSERAFIASHRIKEAAQYGMIYTVSKLVGVMFLPIIPGDDRLMIWGFVYCLSSLVPAFILLYLVHRKVGKPIFRFNFLDLNKLSQGFFFSLSESASSVNAQMDRAMLVGLSSPVAAGIYSAGYRFIDMGYLPIIAVQGASYPRFFKAGEGGLRGTLTLAKKLLLPGILYGLATIIILVLFSPFVSQILGPEFEQSSLVLVWLAPVHLLFILQFLAADSLTGAGYQRARSFIQVSAAVINISLNFYLIPIYSWQGAIWATLFSEVFKSVLLWMIVWFSYQKERQAQT